MIELSLIDKVNAVVTAGRPLIKIVSSVILIALICYLVTEYNPYDKENLILCSI